MANEFSYAMQLRCLNVNYDSGQIQKSGNVSQTAQGAHRTLQIVGTAEEALSVGDVTTYGIAVLYNTDLTNYVSYGSTSFEFRLKPSDIPHMVRLTPGAVIVLKANAAPCKVQIDLFQD